MKQDQKYLILGKRWFQKTYGNTYHSIEITDLNTGEVLVKISGVYGYGDQYQQTAIKWLEENKGITYDWGNHEYNRVHYIFRVVDVERERDL